MFCENCDEIHNISEVVMIQTLLRQGYTMPRISSV
jgi:hypothetical protein